MTTLRYKEINVRVDAKQFQSPKVGISAKPPVYDMLPKPKNIKEGELNNLDITNAPAALPPPKFSPFKNYDNDSDDSDDETDDYTLNTISTESKDKKDTDNTEKNAELQEITKSLEKECASPKNPPLVAPCPSPVPFDDNDLTSPD